MYFWNNFFIPIPLWSTRIRRKVVFLEGLNNISGHFKVRSSQLDLLRGLIDKITTGYICVSWFKILPEWDVVYCCLLAKQRTVYLEIYLILHISNIHWMIPFLSASCSLSCTAHMLLVTPITDTFMEERDVFEIRGWIEEERSRMEEKEKGEKEQEQASL